ncbi:hypothetical protein N8513_01420 [bacterium]|nr:hypothetical protein [Akkermansiaceae bacterium]MDA7514633.1 hypothetical protein [bacterium]MDA8959927.1 hypothetical protein [Akkermansiaceae bacterium]MDB4268210.1 hypothetical protein [Akkermansiaceae bacterium]MDB4297001.1 hypothetical protein [Akkermansiaceae bacterium]
MKRVGITLFAIIGVIAPALGSNFLELNDTEKELFEIIKSHPTQRRTVMQLDPRLCAIARQHGEAMNSQNFFAYLNPSTRKNANDRLRDIGYPAPINYIAGQNFIESLSRNARNAATTVALAWLNSVAHKTHVYGLKNADGSEFDVNQILIGVGYVERTGVEEGYYIFISSHPPEGQQWQIGPSFNRPNLVNQGYSLQLTGIPKGAVFVLDETVNGLGGEWKLKTCGLVDQINPFLFTRPPSNGKYYRIRWTPQ